MEHVTCKVSGMVTEADHGAWTYEQLTPYMDVAFEAFGPRRLMFGSDWPVCTLAAPYDRVHEVFEHWRASLSLVGASVARAAVERLRADLLSGRGCARPGGAWGDRRQGLRGLEGPRPPRADPR